MKFQLSMQLVLILLGNAHCQHSTFLLIFIKYDYIQMAIFKFQKMLNMIPPGMKVISFKAEIK
jgi:hypothetical protein